MKNCRKVLSAAVVIFIMVINTLPACASTCASKEISRRGREKPTQKEVIHYTRSIVKNEIDFSVLSIEVDESELIVAKPYIIVHPSIEVQDEVYYFPIVYQGEVITVLGLIGTEYGYIYELQNAYVELLNELDYFGDESAFFVCSNILYVENSEGIYNISADSQDVAPMCDEEQEYFDLSLAEKKIYEQTVIDSFEKYEYCQYRGDGDAKIKGSLVLRSPQGQYSYGMCWAAASATVINYLKNGSTLVTAFDVCNRLAIGYNDGGTIEDEQDALAWYGIYYNYIRSAGSVGNIPMSWSQVVTNIDNEKPIIANLYGNSDAYHAVTIYGYSGNQNNGTLHIWDSALASGNGNASSFLFAGTYTQAGAYVMTLNGVTYEWVTSLSYE